MFDVRNTKFLLKYFTDEALIPLHVKMYRRQEFNPDHYKNSFLWGLNYMEDGLNNGSIEERRVTRNNITELKHIAEVINWSEKMHTGYLYAISCIYSGSGNKGLFR